MEKNDSSSVFFRQLPPRTQKNGELKFHPFALSSILSVKSAPFLVLKANLHRGIERAVGLVAEQCPKKVKLISSSNLSI